MLMQNAHVPEFMDLNDDVLELIMRNLNIFQQFEMSRLHTRLRNIVQTLWTTRTRRRMPVRNVSLHAEMFAYDNAVLDDQVFHDFMLALKPTMQRLMMHHMDVEKLRTLTEERFESVHTFEWFGHRHAEATKENRATPLFVDDDVLMLQRVFPNLRTLRLRACLVTGKYLRTYQSLRYLTLDDCQYLESEYFRDIFVCLRLKKFDIMEDELNCCDLVDLKKCPTLEHIKIADYHLCMETSIVTDILSMPVLRKLSIYSKNFVFDVMDRMTRQRIKTIEGFKYTGVLHNFGRFFTEVGKLRRLKKLAIYECRGYQEVEGIRDQMLKELARRLPDLCELHFCACEMESYMGLLQFVHYCRELRLLNITNSKHIGDRFIWRCMDLLRRQRSRTRPLELWIKNSDIDMNIMQNPRYIPNERLLKIDTKRMTLDTSLSGVVKFTFAR